MHLGIVRPIAVAAALVLAGSCDKKPPVAPIDDEATLAVAPSTLSAAYDLTATAVSPTSIALAWQDNSTRESGFEVHRSTAGPGGPFSLTGVTGTDVTDVIDMSVPPSTLYCYRVRSFRTIGRKTSYAEFSNTACAKTPAAPPSNASAAPASSTEIDVSWTANASTEDSFRVERSASAGGPWELAATVAPNQTSYRDAGRASEQHVCYRVFAVGPDGESGPSNVDCTAPPLGPTNLTAEPGGEGVDLAWEDNSSIETGYEVRQSDDGVTFYTVAQLGPNSTTFRADFAGSAIRWYQVRATRDGGFSSPSNTASAERTCAASEICANGLDDDCDGLTDGWDESCPGCGEGGCPDQHYCNQFNVCVTHCDNGIQDGDETDVDCGGTLCARCQSGQQCWVNSDCSSDLCVSGTCQNPGGES
ncbi:MAG TPA: fibronectin type III domain-containing protein [Gemmatimonadaceae bacterium]|nr:fibronectin type III domain-containing protein [Gemmatimonadaceae bacterium]